MRQHALGVRLGVSSRAPRLSVSRRAPRVIASAACFAAAIAAAGLAAFGGTGTALACEGAVLAAGTATGAPGDRVEIEVRGSVPCDATGYSFALGHDATRLSAIEARPGPAIVEHAGEDLVFGFIPEDDEGYAAVYVLFDISAPITVPPTTIEEDTLLATIVYEVLPDAPEGATPLLNRSRTFGSPNPVANVFSSTFGMPPIDPTLSDGEVLISEVTGGDGEFIRGDANFDSGLDISDPVFSLSFLFQGERAPPCADAADANDDGEIDISDSIFSLSYLFQGGPPTPPPGPDVPGPDPTPDALDCMP